ncbi:MAG: hypothetical protein ACE1ZU_03710, partial [bacterium]
MTKRKKKKKERGSKAQPVAASRRRALAERWETFADEWLSANPDEAQDSCASEARSLALEEGGPHAFEQAVGRADPSKAEALLSLATAAGAVELAAALNKLLERPLATGLALQAVEALGACGGEVDDSLTQTLARANQAAATLSETLATTS